MCFCFFPSVDFADDGVRLRGLLQVPACNVWLFLPAFSPRRGKLSCSLSGSVLLEGQLQPVGRQSGPK